MLIGFRLIPDPYRGSPYAVTETETYRETISEFVGADACLCVSAT